MNFRPCFPTLFTYVDENRLEEIRTYLLSICEFREISLKEHRTFYACTYLQIVLHFERKIVLVKSIYYPRSTTFAFMYVLSCARPFFSTQKHSG